MEHVKPRRRRSFDGYWLFDGPKRHYNSDHTGTMVDPARYYMSTGGAVVRVTASTTPYVGRSLDVATLAEPDFDVARAALGICLRARENGISLPIPWILDTHPEWGPAFTKLSAGSSAAH